MQWAKSALSQSDATATSSAAVLGTPPRIRLGSEASTPPSSLGPSPTSPPSPSNGINASADRADLDSSSSPVKDSAARASISLRADSENEVLAHGSLRNNSGASESTSKSTVAYTAVGDEEKIHEIDNDTSNSNSNSSSSSSSTSTSTSNSNDEWVSREDILTALKEARPLYPEAKLKVMYGLVDPHGANRAKRAQLKVIYVCVCVSMRMKEADDGDRKKL